MQYTDTHSTVYVHLINCVYVNTHQNWQFDIIVCFLCVYASVSARRQIYAYVCSSHTPTFWIFFKFYAPCRKCILAYVLLAYAADSFWWISSQIVPP